MWLYAIDKNNEQVRNLLSQMTYFRNIFNLTHFFAEITALKVIRKKP